MRSIETEDPRPVDLGHLPESPLVSVLMCNFNYARFIPASLGSLVAQTYPRFEVVVCDNGSTDDSMAVLQQWAASDTRISVIAEKDRGAIAPALNRCYEHASGEIMCVLDSDDVFAPTKIEQIVDACRASRAGLVQHPMIKIDGAGRRFQRIPLIGKLEEGWLPATVLRRGGRWRCGLSSGLALRREIADRLFPLPEGLRRAPDGFVCMVAPFLTPVKVIHRPLAYYRVHGKNLGATHHADRSHFERTLRAACDVLDAANDRLRELGFEFRIDPNDNAFMAELTFALRVLDGSEPRHELAAAFRDLLRRLRAEGVYGERELFLVSVLFGTAILLPEPLRTAWVERARSVRLPRVFQRLASRADV